MLASKTEKSSTLGRVKGQVH